MNIEEVAHDTPENHTFTVEPAAGYSPYVGNEIATRLS
jgi:succinyl-CoA synthetase beta subunit